MNPYLLLESGSIGAQNMQDLKFFTKGLTEITEFSHCPSVYLSMLAITLELILSTRLDFLCDALKSTKR